MRDCARAVVLAISLATAAPVLAADLPLAPPPPAPMTVSSGWHFEATIDGWAPSLSANMGVGRFPTAHVQANIFQILQHLEGIFPASVVAYNDEFIVGLDAFWVRLGLNSKFGPGTFGGVTASTTINEAFVTGYGGVRLPIGSPNLNLYGIVGARYFNLNGSLTLQTPVFGFTRSASQGKDWVDPIVGLVARYRIDNKWFVKAETDFGGYSGNATAQGFAAVGYDWNASLSTSLGYRLLYVYEQQSNNFNGSFRVQQIMHGPEIDMSLKF
jgi:hypothetical protein